MDPGLIDQIYECALLPEHWPAVLERLSQFADARGAAIFVARPAVGILRWSASAGFEEDMAAYVSGGWAPQDGRRVRIFAGLHDGFVTEQDVLTEADMDLDPTYAGFLRPRGLGRAAFTGIKMPTGDIIIVTVDREYVRGPVERAIVQQLDALRPHLARSAVMAARLNLERARAVTETLALIDLPALVFDQDGRVLAANQLIEVLTGHVRWRARDRVCIVDRAADRLFQDAIASVGVDTAASVRSFAVRDGAATASLVAHVLPIRGEARDLFSHSAGVLILTPVTAPRAPAVELVQSLFDLTPAEARVARSLAAGETLDEIAAVGSVSRNTVRSHVRGVLEKTGCRRQAEVVALLSGISV
jgi:DNA-binding CsgD family transcriptional regulator